MINTKSTIENRADLLAEKERLKANVRARKAEIGKSYNEIKDELNPLNLFSGKKGKTGSDMDIKSGFQKFLHSAGGNPLVSMGVSGAANFLLKKIFLRNAGFLPRLILPLVVQKVSDFIVATKLPKKSVSAMHNVADAIRETDVKEVLPPARVLVSDTVLAGVAKTNYKIAAKLHATAEKIRLEEQLQPVFASSLSKKKSAQRNIAKKLHELADAIRG